MALKLQQRLWAAFLMAAAVIVLGTLGYWLILGWSFSDALFMTLTTITTVGYGEVRRLDAAGRAITIALILFGVGTALYTFTMIAQFVVEGEVRNLFRRNRMEREAARLSGHVIICGYGRMGKIVTEELRQRRFPLIVIEQEADKAQEILDLGGLAFQGDATSDEVLRKAGIERARAIVCVVESDAENLYISLSARELNPKIFILSRCNDEAAAEKLRRAGADKVIFPYRLGARQMAEFITRPALMEFLEMALGKANLQLAMHEMTVPEGSFLDGATLASSGLRKNYNVIVVGVRRSRQPDMVFNPGTEFSLAARDVLLLMGEPDKMDRLMADLGAAVSSPAQQS
jgi:voltage-gated potassium channel